MFLKFFLVIIIFCFGQDNFGLVLLFFGDSTSWLFNTLRDGIKKFWLDGPLCIFWVIENISYYTLHWYLYRIPAGMLFLNHFGLVGSISDDIIFLILNMASATEWNINSLPVKWNNRREVRIRTLQGWLIVNVCCLLSKWEERRNSAYIKQRVAIC